MFEKMWRMGNPLDTPLNTEEEEENYRKFFKRIKKIVREENHILKWQDICHAICILELASKNIGSNVKFAYSHGQWFLLGFETEEDYYNLPLIAKEFGRIYRHGDHDCKKCTEREKELFELGESVWEMKMNQKR